MYYSLKNSPLTWLFFIGYIILLFFFNTIDVYHQHFFSTGSLIILYNFFRVFFILCLMWLCYIMGDYALLFLTKQSEHRGYNLSSALVTFFSGLSVWHIVLLGFGFAGWYTRPFFLVTTIALFIVSLPRLDQWIRFFHTQRAPIYWPGLILFLIPTFFFFVTKGLYPSGGHDYFTHYFAYYREVIETGNIMPGRLWYHFYYDKGMGLFFLSALLTDLLGPQLVTTTMILATMGIIFSMIRQSTSWRLLPWIGIALYISFLIYTPGPPDAMRQTGWGDLEKSHEPATLLLFAIIWITCSLARTTQWKLWRVALILNASALGIMSAATSIFAGIYLGLTLLCFLIYKKKIAAMSVACGLIAISFWVALLLLVNYLITGLPDEQSVIFWWPIVNFDKVNEWGGLFEIINLHSARMAPGKLPISIDLLKKIITYLRLDLWGPLLFMVVISSMFFWKKQRSTNVIAQDQHIKIALVFCGGFLFLIFCLSFFIGRDQPVSFYRFTSFTYAPTLCCCLLLLSLFLSDHRKWSLFILALGFLAAFSTIKNKGLPFNNFYILISALVFLSMMRALFFHLSPSKLHPIFLTVLGGFFIWITLHHFSFVNKTLNHTIKNGDRFLIGKYSIADAYRHQEGRPGTMPWGGIYPPLETIWQQLPPKTRIWSWHVHSYCMLPDCDVESYTSFQMSRDEKMIFFGDPKQAKELLKKEHLNYFFFSNQLDAKDPLILSPLFSPKYIADYLGIQWTDGTNTLLTWKENARMSIDADWVKRYQEQNGNALKQIWYSAIKKTFEFTDASSRNKYLRFID